MFSQHTSANKRRLVEDRQNARKRHSRKEILEIAQSMAAELVARAEGSEAHGEALAFLRSAQLLKELVSIADGKRSAAYWTRRPRTADPGPALPKAFVRHLGARLPGEASAA